MRIPIQLGQGLLCSLDSTTIKVKYLRVLSSTLCGMCSPFSFCALMMHLFSDWSPKLIQKYKIEKVNLLISNKVSYVLGLSIFFSYRCAISFFVSLGGLSLRKISPLEVLINIFPVTYDVANISGLWPLESFLNNRNIEKVFPSQTIYPCSSVSFSCSNIE